MRRIRMGAAAAAIAAIALLSGCSEVNAFLHEQFPDQFGPNRGADGRVEAPVVAHSAHLTVGDCFDFTDAADRAEVRIVPCGLEHTFEVIGQGDITMQERYDANGDLQLAVATECAQPFEAFKAAAPEGSRPNQEFLITEREEGERTLTVYSCIAALTKL